jgi:hypothetical protein
MDFQDIFYAIKSIKLREIFAEIQVDFWAAHAAVFA